MNNWTNSAKGKEDSRIKYVTGIKSRINWNKKFVNDKSRCFGQICAQYMQYSKKIRKKFPLMHSVGILAGKTILKRNFILI